MKQKLLKSIKSRAVMLVAMLCTLSAGQAWGAGLMRVDGNKKGDKSLVAVMGSQGDDGDQHFGIVNLIDHAILFVNASRPCFFEDKVFKMFHLSRSRAGMLLQLDQQIGNFSYGRLVATVLDDSQLSLGRLREEYNVCHELQSINHRHNILLAAQPRELGIGTMCCSDVLFNSFHIAGISKKSIARRAVDVWVNAIGRLHQLVGQPGAIALREGKPLQITPKILQCNSGHNSNFNVSRCKDIAFTRIIINNPTNYSSIRLNTSIEDIQTQ